MKSTQYPWYVEEDVLKRGPIEVVLLRCILHVDDVEELQRMDSRIAKVFD